MMKKDGLREALKQRLREGKIEPGIRRGKRLKGAAHEIFDGIGRKLAANLSPRVGTAVEEVVGDANAGEASQFHRGMNTARRQRGDGAGGIAQQ